MAIPALHFRGDIIMMVAWENVEPFVYTNFCGATGVSLNIDNAIQETQVGDCDDWTAPIQTLAAFGAQTVTSTVNAQLAKSNRDKILRWAKDQMILPVRFHIVGATAGEVQYIDGMGMMPSNSIEGIGNTEGSVITTTLNLRFQKGVEFTDAV